MKSRLFFSYLMASSICTSYSFNTTEDTDKLCTSHSKVNIYLNNNSFTDTLSNVKLMINNSLYANNLIELNRSSDSKFYKSVTLCNGEQKISVSFGGYSKDTTMFISSSSSLIISMDYNPRWESKHNGVAITLFKRREE